MKLKIDFDPHLAQMLEAEIKAGEHAVTAAMKTAGAELKQAWREQTVGPSCGAIAYGELGAIEPV